MAMIHLEDGEFEKAKAYVEELLKKQPRNAEAYLCRLMGELKVSDWEQLAVYGDVLQEYGDYKRAIIEI